MYFIRRVDRHHFDGAGNVGRWRLVLPSKVSFLSRDQVAENAPIIRLVKDLRGQELERAAIDAGFGVDEPFQRVVRLPTIGWPRMENDFAGYGPGLWVPLLV